jgi:hypothetical protein
MPFSSGQPNDQFISVAVLATRLTDVSVPSTPSSESAATRSWLAVSRPEPIRDHC